jgi:hypothetical protein
VTHRRGVFFSIRDNRCGMTPPDSDTTPPQPGRPWQFSMKTLLIVTIATALGLTIVVSLPNAIAVPLMICLTVAVPALLTVVLVYGSGYQRTFCIGALFPTCLLLYVTGWLFGLALINPPVAGELDDLDQWLRFFEGIGPHYRTYAASAWLMAVIVGTLAVCVRWGLEARARREKMEG